MRSRLKVRPARRLSSLLLTSMQGRSRGEGYVEGAAPKSDGRPPGVTADRFGPTFAVTALLGAPAPCTS